MRLPVQQALLDAFAFDPEFFLSQAPGHVTTVAIRVDHLRALQDALIELGMPEDADEAQHAQVLSEVLRAAQRSLGGQALSGLPGQMAVPVVLDGGVFRAVEALQHSTQAPLIAHPHAA